MQTVIELSLQFSQFCIMLSMLFCVIRLILGPSAQDRALAMDTLWVCMMLFVLLMGIRFESLLYFDIAILIALTGFISTIAVAKFLMRGEIIE